MTWLVYRIADRTGIEHHALLDGHATVISHHASYPEAAAALVKYREREEREALRAAGQLEMWGGE